MLASEMTMDTHKYGFLASVLKKPNCVQKLLQLGGSGKYRIESEHQHLFVEIFIPSPNWPQPAYAASSPPASSLPTLKSLNFSHGN